MRLRCVRSINASDVFRLTARPHLPKNTFPRVQAAIRPAIKKISDDCMENARGKEVLATVGEEMYKQWKEKNDPKRVPLTVSYDMGWNKRSSGHMYDSVSGHGFILGGLTQKVLHHQCMSKQCTKCFAAKEIKETPIPHECPQNHEGSSKSMEVEGIFRIIQESFYDHRYQLAVIVSDDDSTMKSNLKHSFQQKIDNGLMSIGD